MFEDKWKDDNNTILLELAVAEYVAYIRRVDYPNNIAYQVRVVRNSPKFQVVVKAHKNYPTIEEAKQATEEIASMIAWLGLIDEEQ